MRMLRLIRDVVATALTWAVGFVAGIVTDVIVVRYLF